MSTVIKVEDLSKQYRLGQVSTGTISHDVNRWWHRVRGKEDPYLKIGETNDRTSTGNSDYVWALKDINFEVKQGEVLGIIGRNGAGKSTLLKILSRTTAPTTGSIKIKGRVASLLEVGTGFHPELSGRENIYLNGAILGMTKKEITRKFDEIVAFAGVERYIDTPVKRYSSGMYVRLAFAVAAHLEPEILIVDEVLAVGDTEFQKKCLGKMKDVSEKDGRTVLFVSHQMGAIAQLCTKTILMKHGSVVACDDTNKIIELYSKSEANKAGEQNVYDFDSSNVKSTNYFEHISINDKEDNVKEHFLFTDRISIKLKVRINELMQDTLIGIGIQDKFDNRICTFIKKIEELESFNDQLYIKVELPDNLFAPNYYKFVFALFKPGYKIFDFIENHHSITIIDTGTEFSIFEGVDYGSIIVNANWGNYD